MNKWGKAEKMAEYAKALRRMERFQQEKIKRGDTSGPGRGKAKKSMAGKGLSMTALA